MLNCISMLAVWKALPDSVTSRSRISSWFASMASASFWRHAARSSQVLARHAGKAARAAETARSTSAWPETGTSGRISSVLGLTPCRVSEVVVSSLFMTLWYFCTACQRRFTLWPHVASKSQAEGRVTPLPIGELNIPESYSRGTDREADLVIGGGTHDDGQGGRGEQTLRQMTDRLSERRALDAGLICPR